VLGLNGVQSRLQQGECEARVTVLLHYPHYRPHEPARPL
jgi:hypothetical protein